MDKLVENACSIKQLSTYFPNVKAESAEKVRKNDILENSYVVNNL